MTEKELYVIPQKLVDELSELVPYKGGEKFTDPREYVVNYMKLNCPATYFKNGICQCIGGKNRSFLDLYFLTKAQFPEFTLQEMAKLFLSLQDNPSFASYVTIVYFCDNIGKPVIYPRFVKQRNMYIKQKYWLDSKLDKKSSDIKLSEIFDLAELDYYHFCNKK